MFKACSFGELAQATPIEGKAYLMSLRPSGGSVRPMFRSGQREAINGGYSMLFGQSRHPSWIIGRVAMC